MPIFRKDKFREWTADIDAAIAQLKTREQRVAETIRAYKLGAAGALVDTDSQAELMAMQQAESGYVVGSDLVTAKGFADLGKGKLSIPFLACSVLFPGCFPGAGQERGDCVSHGIAGACAMTFANEIWTGLPDEESGIIEGVPYGPERWSEGIISSAVFWWMRRRGGDGWDCSTAVRRAMDGGCVLMRNYPDLGFDFSDYSRSMTAKYATSGPPANVAAEAAMHKMRGSIQADTMEATRDLMAAGYGIIDCGSEGYRSTRDQNGVSTRSGSWAHSMKQAGFDDRPWAHDEYGGPLVLINNNWGEWNRGPRDIVDSAKYVPEKLRKRWESLDVVNPQTGNIMIPRGAFWTPWSQQSRRYRNAVTGGNGWKPKENVNQWLLA